MMITDKNKDAISHIAVNNYKLLHKKGIVIMKEKVVLAYSDRKSTRLNSSH